MKTRIDSMKRIIPRTYSCFDGEVRTSSRNCLKNLRRRELLLCDAVFNCDKTFVRRLLHLGVNPNCFDHHQRPPLHIAVTKGDIELVELLLKNKADPNIKDGLGNTSLHLAACTNDVEMALILIKGGASVLCKDMRGRNPLQLAQSKLRILRRNSLTINKTAVSQVVDLLLLYVKMTSETAKAHEETTLLNNFQKRLQVTESPEEVSVEVNNLSKLITEMDSLAL